MNDIIKRFYEDLSSGNRAGAQNAVRQIEALEVPGILVESLHFVLETSLQDEHSRDTCIACDSYYNKKIARGVNEKSPCTRIETCPLVSIIIVSYNSSKDLKRLLPSIKAQTYSHYEVVLVENGSEDNEGLLAESISNYVYIQSSDNIGYAEGNNSGASSSRGEYLLLLNPDTRLGVDAIKELLRGISHESSHALAACPKIYFYREFIRIWIKNVPGSSGLDLDAATQELEYGKTFVRNGTRSPCGKYVYPDGNNIICVDFPLPEGDESLNLELLPCENPDLSTETTQRRNAEVYIGDEIEAAGLVRNGCQFIINRTSRIESKSRKIINNAATSINPRGMPFDRGFSDEDKPEYSRLTHVDAFCGCCVLVHRLAWVARRLFFPYFFAYFEDTELSYWLKLHHYQVLYCPASVVYHRHSETTQEKSPDWEYLVNRSRTLYRWMTGKIVEASYAQELISDQPLNDVNSVLHDKIESLYPTKSLPSLHRSQKRETTTVAVYNSFWATMGGGEKHALDVASMISQSEGYEVYLLSERPFEITELSRHFEIDLSKCVPMHLNEVTSLTTGFFDIFINSTYRSMLLSRAEKSYYIVSFPTKKMPPELISTYTFLHNSEFTQQWAQRYWGIHNGTVINPVLGCKPASNNEQRKQKLILSVGRFNFSGHCKNQHLLIDAYYQARSRGQLAPDWRLVIAGSLDITLASSVEHFEHCQKLIKDDAVILLPNAEKSMITELYRNAFAYLHGTGIGVDTNAHPELCEHFGISVFDAIVNSCIPVVHDSGGARDVLVYTSTGMLYQDLNELVTCISGLESRFNQQVLEDGDRTLRQSMARVHHLVCTNQLLLTKMLN